MKWVVFWKDGDVTVWTVAQWSLAQLESMANVIDAVLVPEGVSPVLVATWWREDCR
jgi:hypothetical protein